MTKEEIKLDFIKNSRSNKFHFNRKKYMERLWLENKELRLSIYKKLFILDKITRDEYEQYMRDEGYDL